MKNDKQYIPYAGQLEKNYEAAGCGPRGVTNLRMERSLRGLTQAELAEKSGVSLRTLQDYEQGRKPINQAAAITVYRIAQALGVDVENLLELDK